MTEPTQRQHAAAENRMAIAITLGKSPDTPTKVVAESHNVTQRTVQMVHKGWKENRYGSLYALNVVETDVTIHGKLCGVTKYHWEGKHE